MAALAFSAYGIHWFALGWNRYRGSDPRTNAGMSVAFMVISAMGATVFFKVGDWPVGLLFLGLFAVYFTEFFATVGLGLFERALGAVRIATGLWLMYLSYAVAVDFALGYHWRTQAPPLTSDSSAHPGAGVAACAQPGWPRNRSQPGNVQSVPPNGWSG